MKKDRLLNPELIQVIAALGHKDLLVIGDAGLPVPKGVPVIDLSLVRGIPSFTDTLQAVCSELVVEAYTLADEMETVSPALYRQTTEILGDLPFDTLPHEEFKRITQNAKAIVRTGETTSFANVVLRCGVNF
jgi:D-ribose pyranase